jgi:hypothetical protein
MHAMEGVGGDGDVVGLEDLTDLTAQGPVGETVSQQLEQLAEDARNRLIAQYGEDKYREAFDKVGSKIANLDSPTPTSPAVTRGGNHADFRAIVGELATGNHLMAEALSDHRRERVEDIALQKKINCRGLIFDALNGAAAITAAALSIASLVKVVTELG